MKLVNSSYLKWVRYRQCLVTGCDYTEVPMVAHHVRWGSSSCGMGLKPSDYRVIPLTAIEHQRLHSGVEKDYYEMYQLEVEKVMLAQLEIYRLQYSLPIAHSEISTEELIR